MSALPIKPPVRQVQRLMVQTFDVSEQTAPSIAAETVSLAEGWGSAEVASQMGWSYRIRKDLGETKKLTWLAEEERVRVETLEQQKHAAWDAFISRRKRS